tara:strand:- start:4 stop:237 length:234 start_codon:yes stop_codon:yes gene_type:complete
MRIDNDAIDVVRCLKTQRPRPTPERGLFSLSGKEKIRALSIIHSQLISAPIRYFSSFAVFFSEKATVDVATGFATGA